MKDVKGYEKLYGITEYGEIWSYPKKSNNNKNGKWLKPGEGGKNRKIGRGYKQVLLYKNGIGRNFRIHRLVAETFICNPQNKPQINHIDGNTKNNNMINLEWATGTENNKHAYETGLKVVSQKTRDMAKITCIENNKLKRKLSYETAQNIRLVFFQKKTTYANIARKFNTTGRIVAGIIKNNTYKHP